MSHGSQIPPRCGGHSERRTASAVGPDERQRTVRTTLRHRTAIESVGMRQSPADVTRFLPAGSATVGSEQAIAASSHRECYRPR